MIRKVNKEDISFLNEVLKTSFHSEYEENERTSILVFEEEKVEGFLSFSNLYNHMDINYLWVNENERRKGIASRLMEELIRETKENQISKITLEVDSKNKEAISLYEKFGFQKKAIRKNYYGTSDGILMVLEVR